MPMSAGPGEDALSAIEGTHPMNMRERARLARRLFSTERAALARRVLWGRERKGRITCKEARRHGIAPVSRSHPAYPFMRDAENDGVVCE